MGKRNFMMLALMGMTAGLAAKVEAGEEICQCNKCIQAAESQSSCARLTNAEQDFASKLSNNNKKMFCERFTMQQRKSAMMASCNGVYNCGQMRNAGKQPMKPDDAVSKVMKDNKMSLAEEMSDKRENISSNNEQLDKQGLVIETDTPIK